MAITPSLREELRASIRVDAHARALMNAVTNSNLRSLALNREIMSCHTSFFSHKVEAGKREAPRLVRREQLGQREGKRRILHAL